MPQRIALLGPQGGGSPEARHLESLARGLEERGVPFERISCAAGGDSQALCLSALARRAGEIDLVHGHLGPQLAAYRALLPAPLLLTLCAPCPGDLVPLLEADGIRLAACGDFAPGGVACALIAPAAGERSEADLAADYLALYEEIVERERARLADTLHDRRPWGEYRVLEDAPGHKVKRIDVLPGKRLSYQRHARRAEHWTVVAGTARVTLDGRELLLGPGERVDIPAGCAHRIENPGEDPLTFIEVQRGEYFGEDDIERLQDDFGR